MFPRGYLVQIRQVHGFATQELVQATIPKGEFAGTYRAACANTQVSFCREKNGKKTSSPGEDVAYGNVETCTGTDIVRLSSPS